VFRSQIDRAAQLPAGDQPFQPSLLALLSEQGIRVSSCEHERGSARCCVDLPARDVTERLYRHAHVTDRFVERRGIEPAVERRHDVRAEAGQRVLRDCQLGRRGAIERAELAISAYKRLLDHDRFGELQLQLAERAPHGMLGGHHAGQAPRSVELADLGGDGIVGPNVRVDVPACDTLQQECGSREQPSDLGQCRDLPISEGSGPVAKQPNQPCLEVMILAGRNEIWIRPGRESEVERKSHDCSGLQDTDQPGGPGCDGIAIALRAAVKVLLCIMDSIGLAMQMFGIAGELVADGHAIACVANPSIAEACEAYHVRRIERGSTQDSFTLRQWITPTMASAQFRYLDAAIKEFSPDVLVASPFGFGPSLCAEINRVPLVVIGGMTFSWAAGTYRREDGLRMFDAARVALGLPRIGTAGLVGHPPWLGDRFLLQSSPTLSGPVPCSDRVRWVGDCSWDPPSVADPELVAWLAATERTGKRLIYAQCGREFGDTSIDERLFEVCSRHDLSVAIDTGRSDRPRRSTVERVFARPFIARADVLPRCSLVIASGQPTTTLGALAHRLPMVLLAHGSGTEETVAACAAAGVARVGSLASVTTEALDALITDAIDSPAMRDAASSVAEELARLGGRRRAVDLIAETMIDRGAV